MKLECAAKTKKNNYYTGRRNGEEEKRKIVTPKKSEETNSPHFLLVKYESAAGSLKCLLNIVSAPAWKS